MEEKIEKGFEGWVIIQQMGHVSLAGFAREELVAGQMLLRVDVPNVQIEGAETPIPSFTKYIHPNSLYDMTVVNEDYAREYAQSIKAQPVQGYEHRNIVTAMAEAEFKKLTLPQVTKMAEALVGSGLINPPSNTESSTLFEDD